MIKKERRRKFKRLNKTQLIVYLMKNKNYQKSLNLKEKKDVKKDWKNKNRNRKINDLDIYIKFII